MIMESHAEMNATLRTVFTIFAAAWIGIIAALFVATGLLLKKADALRKKQQHGGGHH